MSHYSQTSRDRLVANLIIALPVLAALGLIRFYQVATEKPDLSP